jgi:hypothetical protein
VGKDKDVGQDLSYTKPNLSGAKGRTAGRGSAAAYRRRNGTWSGAWTWTGARSSPRPTSPTVRIRQLVVHVRWAPKWVRHGIRAVGETPLAVRPHGASPLLADVQTVCAAARITNHALPMPVPAFHVVGASGAQVHGRNRSELRNPFARLRIVCVGRRGENPVCRADAVRGSEGKTCRKDQGCFSQRWICLSSILDGQVAEVV